MSHPVRLRVGSRGYCCLIAAVLCAVLPAATAQPNSETPVTRARYSIQGSERLASVEATFELKVVGLGEHRIPLLPSSVPLESFKAGGRGARVEKGATHYVLCVPGEGDYTASLKFLLAVSKRGQECSITLPLVRATATSVELDVEKGKQTVVSAPEVPAELRSDAKATHALFYPAGIDTIALSWLPADLKRELAPVFEADSMDAVTFSPAAATRRTDVTIEMRRGEADRMSIVVPDGLDVLDLKPGDVKIDSWRVEKDGNQQFIRVRFAQPVTQKGRVIVFSEQLPGDNSGVFGILPLAVEGASRQKGQVELSARRTLTVADAGSSAVRLPVEERTSKTKPGLSTPIKQLAFQYHSLPAEVRVKLTEVQPQMTATTENYVRLQAGLVETSSKLHYRIENVGVRDLRIGLEEGLIVLEVAGKDVETWDVKDRVLAVRLKRPALGAYDLGLRCVQHLRKIDGVLVPQVRCLDAERESGCVGISAGEDVGLTHYHATRFIQVEPQKLPPWLSALSPKLAYSYDQPGGVLAVSTTLIQPAVEVDGCAAVKVAEDMVEEEYILLAKIKKQPVFSFLVRIPDGLIPISLVGDEVADWEFLQGQGIINVSLKSAFAGETRLHLFCERRLQEAQDSIPLGGVAVLGTEHSTGWMAVRTDANLALVPPGQVPKGMAPADVKDAPALLKAYGALLLAYRWTGEEWGLTCGTQRIAPSIRAQTRTALVFAPGCVRVRTDIAWDIEKARVSELLIDLPADAVSAHVTGKDILDHEQIDSKFRVRLAEPVKGSYDLQIAYEQLPDPKTGAFTYVGLLLPQAHQQTGVIGVYLEDPKLEVTEGETKNVLRSNATLPQVADGAPFLGAFQYEQAAHSIAFALKGLAMAGEVRLQAQTCNISTVVKRDGQAVTFMSCRVTNQGEQFFRLKLPEKAVLWATYVHGEPVRPGREKDELLLPVLEAPRGQAFDVGVIWAQPTETLGLGSRLALAAPSLGLPSQQVNWDVYLPQEYEVASSGGNMKMLQRDAWYQQGLPGVAARYGRVAWSYARTVLLWLAILAGAVLACAIAYLVLRVILRAVRAHMAARREARAEAPEAAPRPAPSLSWVGTVLVVVVTIAVLSAMCTPALSRSRMEARKASSISNLHNLGTGFTMYAGDNDAMPPSLDIIRQKYVDSDDMFISPETMEPYVYGGPVDVNADPMTPIVWEAPNPDRDGICVMYMDTHVSFVKNEKIPQRIAAHHGLDMAELRLGRIVQRETVVTTKMLPGQRVAGAVVSGEYQTYNGAARQADQVGPTPPQILGMEAGVGSGVAMGKAEFSLASPRNEKQEIAERLNRKLREFARDQQELIKATKQLAAASPDKQKEAEGKFNELARKEMEWGNYFSDAAKDLEELPPQSAELAPLADQYKVLADDLRTTASALQGKAADIAGAKAQSGQGQAQRITRNLEKWLPEGGDSDTWKMDRLDNKADQTLAPLSDELDDLAGELTDKEGKKQEVDQRARYNRAMQLAESYRKRGDTEKASRNYEYALQEKPDSAEAQQGLKQVAELKKTAPQAKPAKPQAQGKLRMGQVEVEESPLREEQKPKEGTFGKLLPGAGEIDGRSGEGRSGKPAAEPGAGATGGGKMPSAGPGAAGPSLPLPATPLARPLEKRAERYSASAIMSYADTLQRAAGKDWDRDLAPAGLERQVLDVATGRQKTADLDGDGVLSLEAGDLLIAGKPEKIREVKEAAARLREQMSAQVRAAAEEGIRRQAAFREQQREEMRRIDIASQIKATQRTSSGTVTGSRSAGAKPLAIGIPASGTRAYPFHMDYAGTTRPTVELVCLRSGTAIVLQAAVGLIALIVIGFVSYRKVRVGLPLAVLAALVLVFMLGTSGEASKAYVVSALAGVALTAPVMVVRLLQRIRTTETQRTQRTARA